MGLYFLDFNDHCDRAGAEAHLRFFFSPQNSVHPALLLHTQGIFRGSFSPTAQNTISERTSTEGTSMRVSRGFVIFRHETGPEFYRKLAQILLRILPRNRHEIFRPFSPP